MIIQTWSEFKDRLRRKLIRKLKAPPGYKFYPAPSVLKQFIEAQYGDEIIKIEADYKTPLYETIAEIFDYDCYQLKDVALTGNNSIIIDIGANIGVFSILMSKLCSGKILSYEPSKNNCEMFKRNIDINNVNNIEIFDSAVGTVDGEVEMSMNPDESVSCRIKNDGGNSSDGEASFRVNSVRFDSILKKYSDFTVELIKIDCEGGEYDIIDQLTGDNSRNIRNITFEVHDAGAHRNVQSISEKLVTLGYQVKYKLDIFGRSGLHHLLATKNSFE
ncbi:MAG: FkbM family methyltransferase [Geobacter sp.]|nr:FkbM family methyltransferase [Geobacter sp.]